MARYGPWDPPKPSASRHEVTFTAVYSVPGQRTAVYETTQVDRCDASAPQPQAQAWFNVTRSARLDGDGDGIACEDLPGKPTTTTALDGPE